MFDHVMMFSSEAAAMNALSAYVRDGMWTDNVIAPQKVVTARAVMQLVDDAFHEVTPEHTIPGFFLTVCLPALDTTLRDFPENACRLIGDRQAGAIVYTAPDLNQALLSSAIIEPVPAGASYLQGQP